MQVGLTNNEVCFVQSALNLIQKGELKVDGLIGDQTTEAVRKFQVGHRETPSGVVTRETVDALLKELASWNRSRDWVHPDARP